MPRHLEERDRSNLVCVALVLLLALLVNARWSRASHASRVRPEDYRIPSNSSSSPGRVMLLVRAMMDGCCNVPPR